jgi:hypothetical protein
MKEVDEMDYQEMIREQRAYIRGLQEELERAIDREEMSMISLTITEAFEELESMKEELADYHYCKGNINKLYGI